jgi:hypothetical protein
VRIQRFDESDFSLSQPALQFFFPADCSPNPVIAFVVDEAGAMIPARKTVNRLLFVFPHPALDIAGYADIEGSRTAGNDVDPVFLSIHRVILNGATDSRSESVVK